MHPIPPPPYQDPLDLAAEYAHWEREIYMGLGVPAHMLQNRCPFSLPTQEEIRARELQRNEEDARVFEALDQVGRFPPSWPEMEPVMLSRPWTITETEGITIINSRVLPLVEALRAGGDLHLSEDAEAALRLAAMDPPYHDRSGAMSAQFRLLYGGVGTSHVTTPADQHAMIITNEPKSRRWDLIKRGYEHPRSSESCIVYPTNWQRLLEDDAL